MQQEATPDLSIVIVNYKSVALIRDCIASVMHETQQLSYEIIVVDNHSQDDCAAILSQAYPQVKMLELGANVGFARANNAGIRMAKAEMILLLNPDTIILDRALDRCFTQFASLDGYSACCVQLLNEDRSLQISGSYNMPGGVNFLLALPYWGTVIRSLGYALKTKVPHVLVETGITDVDWINGAFMMVKKAAIEQAGGLDEEFFLYAEEIEWCARLRKTGKLCIVGDCQVLHLQGESANAAYGSSEGKGYYNLSGKKGLQLIVSGFLRIRKQFGALWTLFAWFNFLWSVPFSMLGLLSDLVLMRKGVGKKWTYLTGFYKNTFVFSLKYLGKILFRKPYFYKVI